jgi:hypothetical protein
LFTIFVSLYSGENQSNSFGKAMYKEYTVASQSHINEVRNFENNNAVTKRLSLYSLPLSEHITGDEG